MTATAALFAPVAEAERPALWLHGPRYDLWWYMAMPLLLSAILPLYCAALGPQGPALTYLTTATLTGLTHNALTWLLVMPAGARRFYLPGVMLVPFALTAIAMVPLVLFFGTDTFGFALSIVTVAAFYHVVRQHQGMLHVCDVRYVQATGEKEFRAYSRDFRWLLGTVAAFGSALKLTGPPLLLGLVGKRMAFTFYPLPIWLSVVLAVPLAIVATRLAVNTWKRHRQGLRFPTMHAIMAGGALVSMVVAVLMPGEAFFLTLAMVSSYHNFQYFAFCYTHHHLRARETGEEGLFASWARERRWLPWVALPVTLGLAFAAVCATILPPFYSMIAVNWFMISHYFVEANLWRRRYYPQMGSISSQRVEPLVVGV